MPSTLGTNWKWRMLPGEFTQELAERIYDMTQIIALFSGVKSKLQNLHTRIAGLLHKFDDRVGDELEVEDAAGRVYAGAGGTHL